jgi:ubiquinone/menaquinone biosynthesis C-methylase UbiE
MSPTDDSHLALWDDIFKSRPWGKYPSEDLVRFMARTFRAVEDRGGIKVLDVGCGPGTNLCFLVREGYQIAGIDGSPEAIQLAEAWLEREFAATDDTSYDLRVGNFATLDWADEEFDVAINLHSISSNTLKTIQACIGEVHRVLKPGGSYFGKMFGTKTTGSASGVILDDGTCENPLEGLCKDLGFSHFFDKPELETLFSGFARLSIDSSLRTDNNGRVEIFEWVVTAQK